MRDLPAATWVGSQAQYLTSDEGKRTRTIDY